MMRDKWAEYEEAMREIEKAHLSKEADRIRLYVIELREQLRDTLAAVLSSAEIREELLQGVAKEAWEAAADSVSWDGAGGIEWDSTFDQWWQSRGSK